MTGYSRFVKNVRIRRPWAHGWEITLTRFTVGSPVPRWETGCKTVLFLLVSERFRPVYKGCSESSLSSGVDSETWNNRSGPEEQQSAEHQRERECRCWTSYEQPSGIAPVINTFCIKLSETDGRMMHTLQRSDGRRRNTPLRNIAQPKVKPVGLPGSYPIFHPFLLGEAE